MTKNVCIKELGLASLAFLVVFAWSANCQSAGSEQKALQEALPHREVQAAEPVATEPVAEEPIESIAYSHTLLGTVTSKRLNEASGLALSTRSADVAWAHNDSGHGPYIFAFSLKGEERGRFYLEKSRARDWEDMDSFRWKNESWLMIADTGDNRSVKLHYTLYLTAEPEVAATRSSKLRPIRNVQSARIVLPTGPADTEALAVDEEEGRVYLITKRKRPAEVFSLPLDIFKDGKKTHVARFETELYLLPAPTLLDVLNNPNLGLAYAQPNALDISPDRSFAIVHTYGSSYRFDRAAEQTWAQAFASAPKQIDVPPLKQGEAVAIGADNRSVYYTSEGKHPPLYRLEPVTAKSAQ